MICFLQQKEGGATDYISKRVLLYIAARDIVFLNKKTRYRQGSRDLSVFISHN